MITLGTKSATIFSSRPCRRTRELEDHEAEPDALRGLDWALSVGAMIESQCRYVVNGDVGGREAGVGDAGDTLEPVAHDIGQPSVVAVGLLEVVAKPMRAPMDFPTLSAACSMSRSARWA